MKRFIRNWADFVFIAGILAMITMVMLMFNLTRSHAEVLPYVTPDNYGAKNQLITLGELGMSQAKINSVYPGLGCTPGTTADAAAWRKALSKAATTGKMVIAFGTYFFGNDSVILPKFFRVITIYGSPYINVTGTNGSPVFTRPRPTDNGDANMMIGAFVNIMGLQIGCQTGGLANRIGIDIGPTYNSMYTHVDCFSLAEAIHLRFALNTKVFMCEAQYCTIGWTADMGNWPGAGNANSQSNETTFEHCRFNASYNSDYAFGIYAVSLNVVQSCIIEGERVRVGIDYDSKGSTVVKGMKIDNIHFECVNGATEAFIKARLSGGELTVSRIFGQYPAVMVDASSSGGTYPFVEVAYVQYWVPHPTGKYFKNTGCNWALNYNDNFSSSAADFKNMFSGTQPNYCPGPNGGCGGNTYTALLTPR